MNMKQTASFARSAWWSVLMRANVGEEEGGSEIVQAVIVLGFALGIGSALLLLQTDIQTVLATAGTNLSTFFGSITSGMTP